MPTITNAGMDAIGIRGFGNSTVFPWLRYAAFGDGNSSLGETSTQLANELARTADSGGFATQKTYSVEGAFFVAEVTKTFVFTISNPTNATQWGVTYDSSGTPMYAVDTFKQDPNDEASADITLNLQAGDELHIIVGERVALPRTVVDGSVNIQGTSYTTKTLFFASAGNTIYALFNAFSPPEPLSASTGNLVVYAFGQADSTNYNPDSEPPETETASGTRTLEPYQNGSHYRDKKIVVDTGSLNGDLYGLKFAYNFGRGGLRIHFVQPDHIVKTNAQRLTATMRVSWARA